MKPFVRATERTNLLMALFRSKLTVSQQQFRERRLLSEPETSSRSECKGQQSLAEEALVKARSDVQKASAALERFCQDDAKWEQQRTSARRWESSRKWQAITPDELQPAVEAIRHTFEHSGCWRSKQSTMKLCYAALQGNYANQLRYHDSDGILRGRLLHFRRGQSWTESSRGMGSSPWRV